MGFIFPITQEYDNSSIPTAQVDLFFAIVVFPAPAGSSITIEIIVICLLLNLNICLIICGMYCDHNVLRVNLYHFFGFSSSWRIGFLLIPAQESFADKKVAAKSKTCPFSAINIISFSLRRGYPRRNFSILLFFAYYNIM